MKILSKNFFFFFSKIILEIGLQKAETISTALYKGSLEALGKLSHKDVRECFAGATICEILQTPGMTVLDAALKCKCFKGESK